MVKITRRLLVGLFLFAGFQVSKSYGAESSVSEVIWSAKLFDSEEGLVEEHVYQLFEDRNGFFWVLTETDLLFFDGVVFFNVLHHHSPETFRRIKILCQDREGRVWVRYEENGQLIFRAFDGDSRNAVSTEAIFPVDVVDLDIKNVATFPNGDFFLLTKSGDLWQQPVATGIWSKVASCISSNFDFAFSTGQEGIWLVSRAMGDEPYLLLGYWREGNEDLQYFHIPDLIHYKLFSDDQLILVTKTQLGFFQPNGQAQWHPIQAYFPGFDPATETIRGFNSKFGYNPLNGDAFLIYRNQLEISNFNTREAYRMRKKPFLQSQFTAIFDGDQNIWVGTLEGLMQIEYGINPFERILWLDPSENQFFHQYSSRGIAVCPNGKVFFSAKANIFSFDPETKETKRLFYTNNGTSDVIWDSHNQCIWTFGDLLYRFDPFREQLSTVPIPLSFDEGYTFGLHSLGDSLLISNSNGMWIYRVRDQQFIPFSGYGDFPELATAEVYGFFEYSEKELLLYTNKGMYLWEKGGQVTGHYSVWSKGKYHIPALNVRHIHKDKAGVFWLATAEGLIRWEPEASRTRRYTVANGLYDSNLYGVFEDNHGFLWLSTNNGILQFHKNTGITRHYSEEDGITNNEFNRISHEQDEEGNIYFGSLNGITKFDPEDMVFDPTSMETKPIKLTYLSVFSRKRGVNYNKIGDYLSEKRIQVRPGELNLEATFALSDFDIGGGISFAYRIKQLNSGIWIPMRSSSLQIPGLPYGNYDLEIRARDMDLEFGDSYLVIPLEVIPPVYLRKWFILVMSLVFWTLLAWILTRELGRRDEQNRLLQKLVAESTETIIADKQLIELQATELEQKNLEKDRFFANISHEFRTPISLILGPVELLLNQQKNSSKAFFLLETIKKNARQLLKLVNDILLMSKLDHAKIGIKPKPFAIKVLLDDIIRDFDGLFAGKNILLIKNFYFDPKQILVQDEEILRVILQNLLSNAYKYTSAGGKVLLRITVETNGLTIEVKDTGRGIAQEDIPFIFDRYFQSEKNKSIIEGGTGIGLSLVKEVTSLVGGTISVESEWGKGSGFRVRIPVQEWEEGEEDIGQGSFTTVPAVSEPFTSSERIMLQGSNILFVEDNPDYYGYLRNVLGDQFVIHTAGNGVEAIKILEKGVKPVLIITDLMMPEMDGFQFLANLSACEELKKIPVLVLTARVEDESRVSALNFGVSDYVIKPFEGQALLHTINHLVKRHLVQLQAEMEAHFEEHQEMEVDTWITQLKALVEKNLSSQEFSVDQLANEMLMGRTAFYNQVRKFTGLTPNQLILEARLQRARKLLLENPRLTVKEVVKAVGLKHEPHFIDVFQKRFGYTPGQMKR